MWFCSVCQCWVSGLHQCGGYIGLGNLPQSFPPQTLYVPDPEVKELLKEIRDLLKELKK